MLNVKSLSASAYRGVGEIPITLVGAIVRLYYVSLPSLLSYCFLRLQFIPFRVNPLSQTFHSSLPNSRMGLIDLGREADPVLTRIVDEDKVRWWKKPNLRLLYLLLYPTCMGIEITSGFDSQMINGLQLVTAWNKCQYSPRVEKSAC